LANVSDLLAGGWLVIQTRLAKEIAKKLGRHEKTIQRWIWTLKEEGKIEEADRGIRWRA
jgi:transposase